MIAKTICLILTSLTNLACCRPPASDKIASKDDKIHAATDPADSLNLDHVAWITMLTTANYLLLMTLADHFPDIPAIQQLRVLKTWHVALTLLAIGSVLLRQWSYRTLGQFFTVSKDGCEFSFTDSS
jgi:prepilin signal peptidase PulO-like enzyme (type II secretory pathway)